MKQELKTENRAIVCSADVRDPETVLLIIAIARHQGSLTQTGVVRSPASDQIFFQEMDGGLISDTNSII